MRVLVIVISCKMYFLCVSLFHQPFVTLNLVYTTVSTYTSTLLVALLPTESPSYRAISQLHNWWKSISVQYDLSLCLSEKRYIYQSVTKPDSWVTDSQIHYSHLITGLKTYHQVSSIAHVPHFNIQILSICRMFVTWTYFLWPCPSESSRANNRFDSSRKSSVFYTCVTDW